MSFAFPAIDPETSGRVSQMEVPFSRYMGAMYEFGQHDAVLNSLSRMKELTLADMDQDSPVLSVEELNKNWRVGDLKYDRPTKESVARILVQRKRAEMNRQFFLSQGSSKLRFAPGFAAAMIGSVSNPVDLALMFVPFVGEEKAAMKVTTTAGKMFARRLVTRETLKETFPNAPRLVEAIINGGVGQTMFEVPNVIASLQDQADYGLKEAAVNVIAGGTFAAGIHGVVRTFEIRKAARLMKIADRATRDAMARSALNSFLRDEAVDVGNLIQLDERALFEASKFDEDARRIKALREMDVEEVRKDLYDLYGWKTHPETPAAFIDYATGKVEVGPTHWSSPLNKFLDEYPDAVRAYHLVDDRIVSETYMSKMHGLTPDETTSEYFSTPRDQTFLTEREDATLEYLKEAGLSHREAMDRILEDRQMRSESNFFKDPENYIRLNEEVQKRAKILMEQQRNEYDQFGEFGRLRQQEIDRQLAEGKVMPPEKVQENLNPAEFDGTSDAVIDQQINDLKQELRVEEKASGIEAIAKRLEEMADSLKPGGKVMSDPFLIEVLGKPALRLVLRSIAAALRAGKSLADAIAEALKPHEKLENLDKVRLALERDINPPKDFTYSIQSELQKPQPFNVKPERFTPQVIMSKLTQLPKPEQVMLKMKGINEFLSQYKPTEMVDRAKFEEFVDSAMIEPEIRPMLNVAGNQAGQKGMRRMQHQLETAGFTIAPDGVVQDRPAKMTPELEKLEADYHKQQELAWVQQEHPEGVLVDDFVSQNVSVPIAFDKMEKPRTIFLAADQGVHVGSSHYEGVYGSGYDTERMRDFLKRNGFKFDDKGKLIERPKDADAGFTREADDYEKNFGKPRKNMLAWAETDIVDMPDGRRVLRIFEVQSDVRQSFEAQENTSGTGHAAWISVDGKFHDKTFPTKAEAQVFVDQKLREYQEKVQPLIDSTDEVLMKAALKLAKKEGLDGVVISDPRTAMLTQGHLGTIYEQAEKEAGYSLSPEEKTRLGWDTGYEPPSQAAGMTQAYGQKLPKILSKATGHPGEAVELGGRHFALPDEPVKKEPSTGYEEARRRVAGMFDDVEDAPPPQDGPAFDETLNELAGYTREEAQGVFKGFNEIFPGSDSPSGTFFPVEKISAERPFELFTPKQVEAPKPQLKAIEAAVDCLLRKMM